MTNRIKRTKTKPISRPNPNPPHALIRIHFLS
jgi:hypothetical protein